MSNPHSSDAGFPEVPAAAVKTDRRRFSLVWLVPLVAVLIGGWLVVKALTEKGPAITITFKSADGLEAGKTKIKFKDVEIGVVEEVHLGKDLAHVVAKAQLVKEAESFLSENTRFWVVRARVSASAIQGLGTVFSGAYIDVDPGGKRENAPPPSRGWRSRPSSRPGFREGISSSNRSAEAPLRSGRRSTTGRSGPGRSWPTTSARTARRSSPRFSLTPPTTGLSGTARGSGAPAAWT